MKKAKTALWIVILFILQASAAHYMAILGATPILIFSFIASIAILEDNFRYAIIVGLVCGICAGTLLGYNFFLCVAFVSLAVVVVFFLRGKPRYMSLILKVLIWTVIISLIWEFFGIIGQFIKFGIDTEYILVNAIIKAVYNSVITFVIYPLLRRTMYSTEKRKKI